jgi:predicted hydrolase (HD superfamily)
VNREDIEQGAKELGIDLWEHVANVIQAMNDIAEDLGLAGVTDKEE